MPVGKKNKIDDPICDKQISRIYCIRIKFYVDKKGKIKYTFTMTKEVKWQVLCNVQWVLYLTVVQTVVSTEWHSRHIYIKYYLSISLLKKSKESIHIPNLLLIIEI